MEWSPLSLIGWYHVVTFAVIVPALALLSRRRMRGAAQALPPRVLQYRTTTMTLLLFGVFSVLTAREEGLNVWRAAIERPALSIATAAVMLASAIAIMRPRWRRAVMKGTPVVNFFMPQTALERAWWVTVSVLAGVSEEISWRGVQAVLLATLTGSIAAGGVLSAVMFGAAHMMQGWKSAAAVIVFALAFQALYWLSGTLLPGMIIHAAYDIVAGLTYARFGRELNYAPRFAADEVPA